MYYAYVKYLESEASAKKAKEEEKVDDMESGLTEHIPLMSNNNNGNNGHNNGNSGQDEDWINEEDWIFELDDIDPYHHYYINSNHIHNEFIEQSDFQYR